MNIFILEDDIEQQVRLETTIKKLLQENQWVPKKIVVESKPDLFLEEARQSIGSNIYFLDIEIKGSDKKGLDTAQAIRAFDSFGLISFVTTHSEFARLTFQYKVSAYNFIEKNLAAPYFEEQLFLSLQAHFKAANDFHSEDSFVFDNKQAHFVIPFREIFFFETTETSRKIQLVAKRKTIKFTATLEELAVKDKRLYKCHRSYVINLMNIVSIDKKEKLVYFQDDISCLISRRKIGEVSRRMREYHAIGL